MKVLLSVLSILVFGQQLAAQSSDPVDKNEGGLFASAGLNLGQSTLAGGDDTPEAVMGFGAEIGYVVKRDTWGRLEFGLAVDSTDLAFKTKDSPATKVEFSAFPQLLIKAGYGYSLGSHAFGLFRVGVGIGNGEFSSTNSGVTSSSDASSTITMLAWDAVFPASDSMDLVIGISSKGYNVSPDDINGVTIDSFQVNYQSLYGQVRIKL